MMKRPFPITPVLLSGWMLLPGAAPSPAQEAQERASTGFHAFSLIHERNIFNPNRFKRSETESPSQDTRHEPKASRAEFFTLLGTISYDNQQFAYFNGSHSGFRKSLAVRDSIAGHQILDIRQNHVRLAKDGRETQLDVGMQLKRENDGAWELTKAPSAPPGPAHPPQSSGPSSPPGDNPQVASTNSAAEEDDEILKRLLQKREQELDNENR